MKRSFVFTKRNLKELLRDPLSYKFCLGFPLIMLGIMTAVDSIIPAEAGMTLFKIDNLTPGIAVFGLSFIMLFATLTVSKDRNSAFLTRLFTSPMTAFDFIIGYTVPFLIIAAGQTFITYISGNVIGIINGNGTFTERSFDPINALLSCISLIPCLIFFIGLGIFFGALLSDKSAPPCSSITISLCGILGGIWMDVANIPDGNFFGTVCRVLPFSHYVDVSRKLLCGNTEDILIPIIIGLAWAAASFILAITVFNAKMRSDKK